MLETIALLEGLIATGLQGASFVGKVKDATHAPGIGKLEVEALKALTETVGKGRALTKTWHKEPVLTMRTRHVEVIIRAFGEAWRRHWQLNQEQAPTDLAVGWTEYLTASKGSRSKKHYVAEAFARATKKSVSIGDGADSDEVKVIGRALGDPVNSTYYRALWDEFTDPADSTLHEELLFLRDDGAKLEFERHFRLAYAEALASPYGSELRTYLGSLKEDRANLVLQLLVRDIARWGSRHVFGGVERHESLPSMPLDGMYVEPFARSVRNDVAEPHPTPVKSLLRTLLETERLILVSADFGHGKSLTARSLACDLAREYLTTERPAPDVWMPVFVRCADDLVEQDLDVKSAIRHALWRQCKAIGLDFKSTDEAFRVPPQDWRVVYFFDGLDEVGLSERELRLLFERLREESSEAHRFVVLSRPAALPRPHDCQGFVHVQLDGLTIKAANGRRGGQVADWLERWNMVTQPEERLDADKLAARDLLGVARTPIVLFMIAQSWRELPSTTAFTQARIYETFCRQLARGKHALDLSTNKPVAEAADRVRDCLERLGYVERDSDPEEAMLWLMSRVAWESRRLKPSEALTEYHVTRILKDELRLDDTESASHVIRLGVLLALQASLAGTSNRLLFGHKSFLEFLIARYWLNRLLGLPRARRREREDIEAQLSGGRLLGADDRSFEFLAQQLAELDADVVDALHDWAEECFAEDRIDCLDTRAPALHADRRAALRESALAIGSVLPGKRGIRASTPLTLRSLLAWFWLEDRSALVVAPRLESEGAALNRASLPFADLSDANLRGAQLAEADLYKARLSNVDLRESALVGASLRRADLHNARLEGADLTEARLANTNLRGAHLSNASLGSADLHGANAAHATFTDSILVEATLRKAKLEGGRFERASLKRACLDDADLSGAKLEGADLEGATLERANLRSADLRNAVLAGARLRGARLDGADLSGADVTEADLTGVDLTQTRTAGIRGLGSR